MICFKYCNFRKYFSFELIYNIYMYRLILARALCYLVEKPILGDFSRKSFHKFHFDWSCK